MTVCSLRLKIVSCDVTNMKYTECIIVYDENNDSIISSWKYKIVLLVDDQIDVLIVIKSVLQHGYSVDTSYNIN